MCVRHAAGAVGCITIMEILMKGALNKVTLGLPIRKDPLTPKVLLQTQKDPSTPLVPQVTFGSACETLLNIGHVVPCMLPT